MQNPTSRFVFLFLLFVIPVLGPLSTLAQPDPDWKIHDRTRPLPEVVEPGSFSTQDLPGRAPSDAVRLFVGEDLAHWSAMDGSPTKWIIRDGAMECVPGSGYVRSRQSFGDCQLHVEWASPTGHTGSGQGNGNSGVFFGVSRYEVQVLQSNGNTTYADGSAGSIYGQYPPLVNASRTPGQWQVYDIIWTAPRFDKKGELLSKARMTVLHNGVLIQNNIELTGPTSWLERAPYSAHPVKLPIAFQDHGNPVRYRNIWVRELDNASTEYLLPEALLDSYIGHFRRSHTESAEVRRLKDGLLSLQFGGVSFKMHAASPTRFFAEDIDVRCEFQFSDKEKVLVISVGEGETRCPLID